MLEDKHRLHEAGDAGRRLKMAQIRFHRADRQWRLRGPMEAKRFRERMRLDRIADRGAGAVGFDECRSPPAPLPRRRTRRAPDAPGLPDSASEMPLVCPS